MNTPRFGAYKKMPSPKVISYHFACNCEGTEQLPVVNKFYSQADIRNPLPQFIRSNHELFQISLAEDQEFSTFSLGIFKGLVLDLNAGISVISDIRKC